MLQLKNHKIHLDNKPVFFLIASDNQSYPTNLHISISKRSVVFFPPCDSLYKSYFTEKQESFPVVYPVHFVDQLVTQSLLRAFSHLPLMQTLLHFFHTNAWSSLLGCSAPDKNPFPTHRSETSPQKNTSCPSKQQYITFPALSSNTVKHSVMTVILETVYRILHY